MPETTPTSEGGGLVGLPVGALSPELDATIRAALEHEAASKAANMRRAYAADWADLPRTARAAARRSELRHSTSTPSIQCWALYAQYNSPKPISKAIPTALQLREIQIRPSAQ